MIPILLVASFTCTDAYVLIDKMKKYKIDDNLKSEMIQIVKDEVDGCDYETQKTTEGTG